MVTSAEFKNAAQSFSDFARVKILPILAVGSLATFASEAVPTEALGATNLVPQAKMADMRPLRDLDRLPGYNMHVTKQERDLLANATLKLTEKSYTDQNVQNAWFEYCTLLDVSIPGVEGTYGLTANHCFPQAIPFSNGLFFEPNQSAVNVIYSAGHQYDVIDPHVSSNDRANFPIGQVTGISLDTKGVDQGLLQIDAPNPAEQTAPYDGERPLKDVASV